MLKIKVRYKIITKLLTSIAIILFVILPAYADDNLLLNPGLEKTSPLGEGWYFSEGVAADHLKTGDSGYSPYEGTYMWHAANTLTSTLWQDIYLSDLDLDVSDCRFQTGGYYIEFGGYDLSGGADEVQISLLLLDSSNGTVASSELGYYSDKEWNLRSGTITLNPSADLLRFKVNAVREWGTNNNTYFDNGFVYLKEYSIWTYGGTNHSIKSASDFTLDTNVPLEDWNDYFYVGDTREGRFYVTNGATFTSNYSQLATYEKVKGIAYVDGEGSTWINRYVLYVGWWGTGILEITNGGTVKTLDCVIGSGDVYDPFSQGWWVDANKYANGTVRVDGEGSLLQAAYRLYIGDEVPGTLEITNGALVENSYGIIANEGWSSGVFLWME